MLPSNAHPLPPPSQQALLQSRPRYPIPLRLIPRARRGVHEELRQLRSLKRPRQRSLLPSDGFPPRRARL
jgi:hypothetical protein